MFRVFIISTLALSTALLATDPTVATSSLVSRQGVFSAVDGATRASSKKDTVENINWVADLLELNPEASFTPTQPGFIVDNPPGKPLVLPKGKRPGDVDLTIPKN